MSEACKTRLFSPLPRNKSAPFSHALGCLSAGNPLPTVRAVFDAVRGGRKERAAHGTFLSVLGLIEFRIEQLIKRKYGNPKPLTEQGIGNELRAYASVPVVQYNTVAILAVAALLFHKGVYLAALSRRQPLNPGHTSSAG